MPTYNTAYGNTNAASDGGSAQFNNGQGQRMEVRGEMMLFIMPILLLQVLPFHLL